MKTFIFEVVTRRYETMYIEAEDLQDAEDRLFKDGETDEAVGYTSTVENAVFKGVEE